VGASTPVQTCLKNIEEPVLKEERFPYWAKHIEDSTILQTIGIYEYPQQATQ
jgi:hypothetical protein